MTATRGHAPEVPIGDLCDLVNGRAFEPGEWTSRGLPIVRIQNLNDESKPFNFFNGLYDLRHEVNDGDLLFSWSGTPGTSFGAFFWNRGKGVLNQHIFNVRIDADRVDRTYFRYAINHRLDRIIAQAHGGVGLQHITKGRLEAVTIPLPPLSEQKRIAAILDQADSLRRKRKQSITVVDQFLRSSFINIFGDPVTNPKEWPIVAIRDVATRITKGESPKWQGFDYQDNGVQFITSENVRWGKLDVSDPKFIPQGFHDQLKRSQLAEDDVLINLVGASVGRTCIVPRSQLPANVNQAVAVISVDQSRLTPTFWLHQILAESSQQKLLGNVVESARANISLTNVKEHQIILPELSRQKHWSELIVNQNRLESSVTKSKDEIEVLFDSLVQRAFKGEL